MSLNQTAESNWSEKQLAWAMACWTTARSSGSCCAAGWTGLRCAAMRGRHGMDRTASSSSTRQERAGRGVAAPARRPGRSGAEPATQELERSGLREVLALLGATVPVFERAGLESAFANDDAMRNPQQLGVGELDARA